MHQHRVVERAAAAKALARRSDHKEEAGGSRVGEGDDIRPGGNNAQHEAEKEEGEGKPGPAGDQVPVVTGSIADFTTAGGDLPAGDDRVPVSKRIRIE